LTIYFGHIPLISADQQSRIWDKGGWCGLCRAHHADDSALWALRWRAGD